MHFCKRLLYFMTSPPSSIGDTPPYYVLVSQAPLQTTPSAAGPSFKSFGHPTIEYHYADDLPHALLPQSAQEHVLVLDYDPTNVTPPRAQSLSTELAVVGVQVADAPAASSTADDSPNPKKNSKIYVIETTAIPSDSDCMYVCIIHLLVAPVVSSHFLALKSKDIALRMLYFLDSSRGKQSCERSQASAR